MIDNKWLNFLIRAFFFFFFFPATTLVFFLLLLPPTEELTPRLSYIFFFNSKLLPDAVQTINQLLTEMDGFGDNTGVIVMAATNRPAALDSALTRPGRFDRMVVVPLPDVQGRADILAVHCRNKRVEKGVELSRIARSTAGFTGKRFFLLLFLLFSFPPPFVVFGREMKKLTFLSYFFFFQKPSFKNSKNKPGAMLCNITEMAALVAVRRGATAIAEADFYQALEDSFYKRGNKDSDSRDNGAADEAGGDEGETRVPASLQRAICVYEAGRALVGSMLPEYEELAKVVACPDGAPTGFAHFVPREEHLETGIMTRGYCESLMVSRMAGRAAERLALGDGGVTTAGGGDLLAATTVARELLLRAGLSRSLGPVACMDTEQVYGRRRGSARSVGRFGSVTASAAMAEIEALLRAAEAKVRSFFVSLFFSPPLFPSVAFFLREGGPREGKNSPFLLPLALSRSPSPPPPPSFQKTKPTRSRAPSRPPTASRATGPRSPRSSRPSGSAASCPGPRSGP